MIYIVKEVKINLPFQPSYRISKERTLSGHQTIKAITKSIKGRKKLYIVKWRSRSNLNLLKPFLQFWPWERRKTEGVQTIMQICNWVYYTFPSHMHPRHSYGFKEIHASLPLICVQQNRVKRINIFLKLELGDTLWLLKSSLYDYQFS